MKHQDFIAYMAPQRGCDGSRTVSLWVPLCPEASSEQSAAQAVEIRNTAGGVYISNTMSPAEAWETIEQAVDVQALAEVSV